MSQIDAKTQATPQPTPSPADQAEPWIFAGSIFSLIGANVLAIGTAVIDGWNLYFLMIIYWAQSVIIGVSSFYRLRAVEHAADEHASAKRGSKRKRPRDFLNTKPAFFALHYGFFHAIYLLFLLIFVFVDLFKIGGNNPLFEPLLWGCIAAFAVNHYMSHRHELELDRRRPVTVGAIRYLPYFRIAPMHLTILFAPFMATSVGLIFFGTLKAVADVYMHIYEHKKLRSARTHGGGATR